MTLKTATALTMTLGVTEAQADHIEKYEIDKLYNFKVNRDTKEITFKGSGCSQKYAQIEKLISKI